MNTRYLVHVLSCLTTSNQGFFEKVVLQGQNASLFCSAHSGQPMNYTTVRRGMCVKRLSQTDVISSTLCTCNERDSV